MKTYYGNYLGLVVDDKDPQQRGRVKVFIPHIMPALYEDWNKEGTDIKFNITDSGLPTGLNAKVVDRLQKVLPWAECAAPIFGAGPAGIYNNSTGALDRGALNCGNGNCGQSRELMSTLDGADLQGRAAAAVEAGLLSRCGSQGLCARGANNILSWYVTGRSWAANNDGDASSGDNARDFGPILGSRFGMSVIRDTGTYQNGDTRILTGSGGTQHMETYMNGRWYSDFAQDNSSLNNPRYNTATLYRLPGLDDPLPDGAYAAVEPDLPEEDEDPKKKNPSDEVSLTADANSKTDPTKEEGIIKDEGSEEISSEPITVRTTHFGFGPSRGGGDIYGDGGPDGRFPDPYTNRGISATGPNLGPGVIGSTDSRFQYGDILQRTNPITGRKEVYIVAETATASVSQGRLDIWTDPNNWESTKQQPDNQTWTIVGKESTIGRTYADIKSQLEKYSEFGEIPSGVSAAEWLASNGYPTEEGESGFINADRLSTINNPAADPTVFVNTNDIPTGMFGSARTGQMVWVFFQEGDPLFPVYFAASYGQKEWANVRQHSSPDKIKKVKTNDSTEEDPLQGSQTTLSLNAGGFKDAQWISGQPSGFEEDEFAFQVYGKNGSNLTFTFHTTHLNSKYDFRQHTQADAHYITGGNREDRITGDFNTFCEQDVVVTIGNWSTEALQAAANIQDVVDRAMKAAKDTYES